MVLLSLLCPRWLLNGARPCHSSVHAHTLLQTPSRIQHLFIHMTTISSAAGKAFAEKFVTQFAAGFKENNHTVTLRGLLADKLSWDWSDDTKGSGTPADITGIFAKSPGSE